MSYSYGGDGFGFNEGPTYTYDTAPDYGAGDSGGGSRVEGWLDTAEKVMDYVERTAGFLCDAGVKEACGRDAGGTLPGDTDGDGYVDLGLEYDPGGSGGPGTTTAGFAGVGGMAILAVLIGAVIYFSR